MALTASEKRLKDSVERDRIIVTNQQIRKQLNSGIKPSDIASQFGLPEEVDPNRFLASMAISEQFKMNVNEAYSLAPTLSELAFGKNADMGSVAKAFFSSTEEFSVPFKPIDKEEIETQLAGEVKTAAEFKAKETEVLGAEKRAREIEALFLETVRAEKDISPELTAQNLAAQKTIQQSEELIRQLIYQDGFRSWGNTDPDLADFNLSMVEANTDDERKTLIGKRRSELFKKEQERIDNLFRLQERERRLEYDPPGIWESKLNAWRAGSLRVVSSGLDFGADAIRLIGNVPKANSSRGMARALQDWARAYHKISQDLPIKSVNTLDEMTNAFLQNAPYSGMAITAAVFSPNKVTPFVIFMNALTMEGSSAKQQALDNGFSEKMARSRGWLVGTANGMIEAIGGGAAKYDPRKLSLRIATFPGKLTRVALREIFTEEIPQELISMGGTNSTPRNQDGSIDWDEFTDQMILIARDTAFTSSILTTASSTTGSILNWDRKRIATKVDGAITDAVGTIITEKEREAGIFKETFETEEEAKVAMEEVAKQAEEKSIDVKVTVVGKELTVEQLDPQDDLTVETEPTQVDMETLAKSTPRFGLLEQAEGGWAIIDWETQQEIETNLSQKEAQAKVNQINATQTTPDVVIAPVHGTKKLDKGWAVINNESGKEIQQVNTKREASKISDQLNKELAERPAMPTEQDIETLTHRELLNLVLTKASQQTRKAVVQTTRNIVQSGKDIVAHVKLALKGLNITISQRNAIMSKLAKATNDEDVAAVIEAVELVKEIQRHKAEVSVFKKLRRLINKNSKRRLVDGGVHWKVHDILRDLLDNYTTLSPKILNSLSRTRQYLDGLRDELAGNTSPEYAEGAIPRRIMDKLSELTAKPLTQLSADEVQELNDQLKMLLKNSQLWGSLSLNAQKREGKNFLNNAVNSIKFKAAPVKQKKFKPTRGVFKALYDSLIGEANDDIYTTATTIWGRFDPISQLMMRARRKQQGFTAKYISLLRGIIDGAGITLEQLQMWSPNMHVIPGSRGVVILELKAGGKTQEFTKAELASFLMHTRNGYNLNQIVKNGIATRQGVIGDLSKEEMRGMLNIISKDPMIVSLADALEEFYTEMGNDINHISTKLDGIKIATLDNYYHVEYAREGGVIGKEYIRPSIMDENGRLRQRVGSNAPVMIRDIFEVLTEDIAIISEFVGTSEAVRKLRLLANYKPFRDKMRESGHESTLGVLGEEISRIQVTKFPAQERLERAVSKLDVGLARAILINPKIWALQPTSAALYATEVSGKYMRAIRPTLGADIEAMFNQNWMMYRMRKKGFGASKSLASTNNIKKILTGTGGLADKAMAPMHRADLWGVTRAGQIVLAEMADPNLSGYSLGWWRNYGTNPFTLSRDSSEFWDAFNDRADYIVTRTQPMFFSENKSHYTGSQNALVRSMTRFRSFIDQIGRIIRRQQAMARYGDISKGRALRNSSIAISMVSFVSSIMAYMFDLLLGRDRKPEDLLRDIIVSPLGILPFIGFPAKKVAATLIGARTTTPEFSAMPIVMIDSIMRHSWEIAKGLNASFDDELIRSGPHRGEWKSERFLKSGVIGIFSDVLTMYGVPIRTIQKIEWFED